MHGELLVLHVVKPVKRLDLGASLLDLQVQPANILHSRITQPLLLLGFDSFEVIFLFLVFVGFVHLLKLEGVFGSLTLRFGVELTCQDVFTLKVVYLF